VGLLAASADGPWGSPSATPQSCGPQALVGASKEGKELHPSPLRGAPTPARPMGSSKSMPTLGEDGVMVLGQVGSGTSRPSSSSGTSFVGGSYGHGYRHSLQLEAQSSRKPELSQQSPFESVLSSLGVLKIYFSSKEESQSFPLRFLACPTPEEGVAWPRWQAASHKSLRAGWFVIYCPPTPPNIFKLLGLLAGLPFIVRLPLLCLLAKHLSEAFHARKNLQSRCIGFEEVHLLCFGYGLSCLTLTSLSGGTCGCRVAACIEVFLEATDSEFRRLELCPFLDLSCPVIFNA